jgi:hypothetical protein
MEISAAGSKASSSSRAGATDRQFFAFWVAYSVLVGSGYVMLWKASRIGAVIPSGRHSLQRLSAVLWC